MRPRLRIATRTFFLAALPNIVTPAIWDPTKIASLALGFRDPAVSFRPTNSFDRYLSSNQNSSCIRARAYFQRRLRITSRGGPAASFGRTVWNIPRFLSARYLPNGLLKSICRWRFWGEQQRRGERIWGSAILGKRKFRSLSTTLITFGGLLPCTISP